MQDHSIFGYNSYIFFIILNYKLIHAFSVSHNWPQLLFTLLPLPKLMWPVPSIIKKTTFFSVYFLFVYSFSFLENILLTNLLEKKITIIVCAEKKMNKRFQSDIWWLWLCYFIYLPNRDGLSIVILIGILSKIISIILQLCWFFMILIAHSFCIM